MLEDKPKLETASLTMAELDLAKLVLGGRQDAALNSPDVNGCELLEDGGGIDPKSIFPTEIWEKILTEVDNAMDIYNCSKTCELWRSVLKSTESRWLFRSTFSSIFPYLDKQDVLGCRSVCKYWNKSVDLTLENHGLLQPLNEKGFKSCYYNSVLCPNTWLKQWKDFTSPYRLTLRNFPIEIDENIDNDDDDDEEDHLALRQSQSRRWDRFNSEMKLHSRNPLIGRSLSIEMEMNSALPLHPIWNGVDEIFKHVGGHLRYCDIIIQPNTSYQMTLDEPFSLIRQCLEEAHLLRKLRFSYPRSKVKVSSDDQQPPLPDHRHLEMLELHGTGTEVYLERVLLKNYSSQLKSLQVDQWLTIYSTFNLSSLNELQVERVTSEESLSSFLDLDCPKLKKFSICLNMNSKEQLRKLLEITRHFPTLGSFHFNLDYLCPPLTDDDVLSLPPNLLAPVGLQTLEVGHHSKISYSCLQRFPSIQCLHLVNFKGYGDFIEDDVEELVEVHGPLEAGRMQDSNIWKILPNLRHVSFREREESPTITKHWERKS